MILRTCDECGRERARCVETWSKTGRFGWCCDDCRREEGTIYWCRSCDFIALRAFDAFAHYDQTGHFLTHVRPKGRLERDATGALTPRAMRCDDPNCPACDPSWLEEQ